MQTNNLVSWNKTKGEAAKTSHDHVTSYARLICGLSREVLKYQQKTVLFN